MTKTQNPEAQTQALAEFKVQAKLLERDKEDDEACCRFLRARQYNVDKAVEMYDAYLLHIYIIYMHIINFSHICIHR